VEAPDPLSVVGTASDRRPLKTGRCRGTNSFGTEYRK